MKNHIHPTPEAGKRFYQEFQGMGKVVMLNLLKFRVIADYDALPELRPDGAISGEAAYQLYMEKTLPVLEKAGSKVLFYGRSKDFLIGPEGEGWDAVLLVAHASVDRFIAFSQDAEYLKTAGHRTAALEDSRLLPIREV